MGRMGRMEGGKQLCWGRRAVVGDEVSRMVVC